MSVDRDLFGETLPKVRASRKKITLSLTELEIEEICIALAVCRELHRMQGDEVKANYLEATKRLLTEAWATDQTLELRRAR